MVTNSAPETATSDPLFELLDIPAIVSLTHLSERFVTRLVYSRRVPVVKLGPRVFVRRSDLAALIENNTSPAREA